VLRDAPEILELLAEAAQGRVVLLTSRELRSCDNVDVSALRAALQTMGQHEEHCLDNETREMLEAEASENFGHAPFWLAAGARLEELLVRLENHGPADYIFCLDPWAAQIRSKADKMAPTAAWVLISDLDERKKGKDREYWEQLEAWFEALPFAVIVPRKVWDQAISPAQPPSLPATEPELFAAKPGAWRWRRLTSSPKAAPVVFLVRYSGSLGHLRVFLDSVVRQEGPKDGVHIAILAGVEGEDPRAYLQWFDIAHPGQRTTLIGTSGIWKTELSQFLGRASGATVVMAGDHSILPSRFTALVRQGASPRVLGIPASLEVTAHVLTGNLDPIQNYETLLQSFSSEKKARGEAVRIVSSETWNKGTGDPADRLLAIAQEPSTRNETPFLILELADLP
jgi:hypothetical protein